MENDMYVDKWYVNVLHLGMYSIGVFCGKRRPLTQVHRQM